MKRYLLSLLTGIILSLLAGAGAVAQNELELAAGSRSTALTGPTTTPLSASLLENTDGTTFITPATPISVSLSLSNQQYTGTFGNLSTGVVFGAGGNNNASSAAATALSQPMNALSSPTSSSFTASPCGPVGTGIDVSNNYALRTFLSTKPLAGKATTATYQYADLTITFSQPVTNPVLQFVGLGETFNGGLLGLSTQYFSTQLVLLTSGVTLSKLSGSSELTVLSSTTIANGATQPSANCGSGAACGSVRATGTNITTLTFRVYLRGVGSSVLGLAASAWDATNAHGGDSFLIGVSLDAPPTPTSTTLTNACPATTADLTSIQPDIAGATYEWHTAAFGPTSANLVGNAASVNAGTYYLYSLNATNCYSPASASVTVTLQNCSGATVCSYLSNTDFEVSGQNPSTFVIASQTTLVPPWRTTASDGMMELWRTGFQGVPAYSGNQFIELNANLSATTYQNFTAAPGATFTLNFAHRGRAGTDVMNVTIGSPSPTSLASGTAVSGTVYNDLGNFSDGNSAWGYYTRTFTIPANATGTTFSVRFTTVSTGGGDVSAGNFLDAISISDIAPAPATTGLAIVCPATTADLSSLTATNKPVSTTQTFHSGPVATSANKLASTVVGPGTYYTAFFNGQKGCYGATTAIVVTLTTPVAPTVTVTAQPTCTVSTGTITVSAPTGAGLTYSIDGTNYQGSTIFTGVAPGTYVVTVRNGSTLCTSPATSVTVNASLLTPAAPSVTTVQTNCTLATGTISVTAPTGAGLTYSINGTTYQSATTFTGVSAGTYAVTVKNATNCVSAPTSVTINTQPATPVATLTSATICNGTSTTLTAGGGGTGGSYLFSTGLSNTTGLLPVSPTVNGSSPYSVTVTSAQGCSAVASATVTVNAAVTATLTSATFCTNDNAILVATGGSSYAFSNGTSNTSGSLVLSPGVGGTYSVTVTSAQGCSAVATGTVTSQTCSPAGCTNALINPGLESPVVSATNGIGALYYGNSVPGWYAPFASGIGLARVNGAGFANGPNNAEDGNQYVFINATGDFLAQNFTLSCASSLNFSGYFANNSTNGSYAPWTAQITILDAGGNIVASSATKAFTSAIGDETWYPLTGSSVVLPAGNYRFYVKVTGSGYFDTANLCITPCPACSTPILSTTAITNACSATTGDLSTITASNTPASTSLTFHSATPATTANTVSNSVVSGTYYAAFYSASSNCYGPTVPVSVTVVPTPVAATVSVTQPTCTVATGTITITAPTGAGLTYSINGTTYTASATFTGVSAGTYSVTVKNSINCVSPVTSVTINTQPATPVATLSSATICNGLSTTLTATGGATYLFSTGQSTTAATATVVVNPNTTTPYSVTVTSAQGCSAVATATVTVNPSVTATLTSATICNGLSGTLTASGAGTGGSYVLNPGNISSATGVFTVSPTTNGVNTYTVTATSQFGCVGTSTGTVTVNPSVTATLSSATICNGTSATVTATGGASYRFSEGTTNTTGLLTVSPTTNGSNPYSVTVTSAQGCSAVASGSVTVNPSVTATLSSATICNNTSTTLTATGGTTYLFSTGLTNTTGLLPVSPTSNGSNPYSVTVTSAQGCTAVASGTVTVNPSVTATLSSATICNGTSTTLTATGGTNYRFSEGTTNTTGILVVTPTTNGANPYSVTVTSAQSCSAVTSGTVTVNPSVTATLSSATICNGTSTTLTATGGTSYRFSTGVTNTTGLLAVSPATNGANPYSVTVTSAQGCSALASGTVTVNAAVTATLSSATICNGTSTTLTATGGASYLFSTGTNNTTGLLPVSPTTNGSNPYSVTVTSAQGCTAVASGTVTVNPSVTATLSSATICNGTSTTLTATGGTSYRFSEGTTNTTGLLPVSPMTNGSNPYSVTVTSAQGCSAVASGTVTVNPSVTATLSVATICNGTSTTLTATGGSSYRFSEGTVNATGVLVVAPNSNGNNPYSVTVTSAQGCTAVATGNVTVNPSVTATLSSATICNGTSATLTATGGVSYRFGPGNSNTTGLLVVAPTAVGSNPYSVTVTSAQGCSAVAFGNVTVNALPQPTIAGTMSVCAGQPISLTASPTTGLTYAWTGPGGNLGSSNPLTLINSTSANSGTYQVRVTDINGCTAVASRNVTVKPVPQAQILNTSIVCANNAPAVAIATQVTGGSPPVSYAWYRSGAMGVISTDPNPVFSVADTYSLIVTDASGCLSNTATVAVMTPNPLAVNVQTANARCFGAQGTITVTTNGGTAPYTVSYYNGSGLLSSTMTSGASTLPATAGSYTIVVMDTNGCSLTQTAAITQPPLLTATLTGSGSVCAGQNTGSITSSVAGGTAPYSYAWSNGAITPNLTGLSGGTYTVVITDANGCTTAQTITLPTNPLPATPTVSVTQPTCITLTGTIRVLTPTTGVQYTFNNGINYQATPTMAGLAPDVYQVRVKDNTTGCVSLPASVTINPVPNPPVVSITGNTTYCAGQPISLTASPASGVTYAWNGPSGNLGGTNPLVLANATPGQTGLYQVTVTDTNGCTAVATTSVLVYALPIATLTANSTTMCYGQPISLTAGGGTGYAFSPNVRGVTGNTASFTAASGTAQYSVTVTSAQGCLSAPAVVTITVSSCVIPLPDSGTASAGTGGVAVASVLANDLINTLPGTVGANGNATIATIGTYPAGITLNPATGSVSVAVGTAPGNYTIAYQLCDKLTPVTCATTTVTVLVSPSVVANPDSGTAASATGGVAIADLTANDRVNGLLASLGAGGNATIAPLGSFPNGITLDPQTGTVSVAPGTAPNTYTLTYQLCDRLSPITCATTTLTVLVTPAPPVLTDDINTLNINATALGNVLTNDYDPQGLPLSVTLVSPPALGTLRLSPAGSYTYTPPTDFTGLVSFTYQACNPAALCQTATATLTVLANPTVGNNPPLARNDATRTRQGQALRIVVLANDSDPDAPALAKGQLTAPVLVSGPAVGTAVVNPDGSITYTPPAVFTGGVSFTYQVCDGGSPALCSVAQVTVSVLAPALGGAILAPVGIDDGFLTRLNTALVGDVSANDLDANSPVQPLSYSSGQPQSGTVVMSGVGSYTYTPAGGYSGPVSFTYAVCNPAGLCGVATVYGVVQVTDKVTLLGRVYLQGALLGVYRPSVLMRDDLRAKGLLPLSSPYGSFGALTPVGSLSSSVTGVTGVDAVVDWVYVELRSAANPALVVDSRSALLQRDGDIVDVDGVSGVRFDVAEAGSYYVAVRHRNHLGAMSGLSVPLSVSGVVVDLRTGSTPMYSYSASALNQALVGVDQGFALWAGNALSDAAPTAPHEVVQFQGTNNDPNILYQRVISSTGNLFVTPFFKLKGYYDTDIDMNGETLFQGSGNDVESIYQNVTKNHPGNQFTVPFFRIREQLP